MILKFHMQHDKAAGLPNDNQSAKGTEMTDSMKTWQKSDFL